MFGFACNETAEKMPLTAHLAHRLMERHATVRGRQGIRGLRPDAKSQVTVRYRDGRPAAIDTIVLSTQHTPDWNGAKKQKRLKDEVIRKIIEPVVPARLYDRKKTAIHVNPTGQFEIGGPHGDTGLTGRKIIVDTYGGHGSHGGGAFSGKDPSKVDRSASYMARYIAKNLVAAGLAEICEVQLSYAIGIAEPVSVFVDTRGTGVIEPEQFEALVRRHFALTPEGMIRHLKLLRPFYRQTARHGHFGRKPTPDGCFSWEKTDKARTLQAAAKKLR